MNPTRCHTLWITAALLLVIGIAHAEVSPATKSVTCEVRWIELPRAQANRLISSTAYVLKPDVLAKIDELIDKKKATILAQPKTTTLSGIQAQTKTVREFIYPTQLDNGERAAVGFKTREVGVILNFTPTTGDNGWINIALTPEMSQEATTGPIRHEVPRPTGVAVIDQPDFSTWSCATSIILKSGSTVLLATHDPVRGSQILAQENVVLVLLTATINPAE